MKSSEEEAWREQLERDVTTRIKYGFCHVHKPVLDDEPYRAFGTMAEYGDWCERDCRLISDTVASRPRDQMPASKFTPAQAQENQCQRRFR